jgi:hypothetical protein
MMAWVFLKQTRNVSFNPLRGWMLRETVNPGGLFYHRLARDLRPVAAKRIKGRDERFFLRLKGAE